MTGAAQLRRLGAVERALLDALLQGGAADTGALVQRVYGADPNGGPVWAEKSVRNALARLRRRGVAVARRQDGAWRIDFRQVAV